MNIGELLERAVPTRLFPFFALGTLITWISIALGEDGGTLWPYLVVGPLAGMLVGTLLLLLWGAALLVLLTAWSTWVRWWAAVAWWR